MADAVQAYTDAAFARGSAVAAGSPVEQLVTPDLLSQLTDLDSSTPDDQKRDFIGTVTLAPDDVKIDGDKATYAGCQDGSKAYSVLPGETAPGAGSSIIGFTKLDIDLVRQDDRWLVNDPQGEAVASC